MRLIEMKDYNRSASAYWWTTTLAGAVALGYAAAGLAGLDRDGLLEVALLVAVVYLAGLHPIRIPGTQSVITASDIFIFLAALFLGAPAATLVAVTDAFATTLRKSRRWTSWIGAPALISIAIFASASMFQELVGLLRQFEVFNSATLLVALLLFSAVYFLLNSLLVTILHSLKRGAPLIALWWSNYCWTSLTFIASASAAGLIYLAIEHYGISSLLAAGPLVAVIIATCHFYFKQADERAKAAENISRLHLATVEALATAIDAKDEITHDHVYRVQVYACGLARHFGLSEMEIEALNAGALLHDVGKIAVPDYILNKPGKLTAAEFEKMKMHTVVGAQIMERVNFPYPVVPIVRHHHERWDGRGYPDGLKGEQIPKTARILTVVDVFDAVREDRQYHKGLSRVEACELLRRNAGTQFDPQVVEAFLTNLPAYEEEIAAYRSSQAPALTPTTQAGLSESGLNAAPAAGLAQAEPERPDYLKQISAAHAEVAALYEMAQTFSTSIDVRDVVTLTMNRIERMIPFTTCVVYLRQAEDDSAVASYVFGKNADQIRGRSLAAGHGIAGWVVINGRPMNNTDPMLDLNNFLGSNDAGYRTAAVFPLTRAAESAGAETIGALAVYTSEIEAYSSNHLHLLESVARLASTALQHAILYEQTKANAQTDVLTGLANGRALYARLDQEMAKAKEHGGLLTVLSFNLTGMRAINDTYGYQAGDRVLVEAAEQLRRAVEDQGMLSRIAGGEFICLLTGQRTDEAALLGEQAQEVLDRFTIEVRSGQHARVGLSFGVASFPTDGGSIDELLHRAAASARKKKDLGKNEDAHYVSKELRLVSQPKPTQTATELLASNQ
jgi:diguanylate cyclase (GGDEF)-like protein/putative nucleotidyltransferase with HDIG domain